MKTDGPAVAPGQRAADGVRAGRPVGRAQRLDLVTGLAGFRHRDVSRVEHPRELAQQARWNERHVPRDAERRTHGFDRGQDAAKRPEARLEVGAYREAFAPAGGGGIVRDDDGLRAGRLLQGIDDAVEDAPATDLQQPLRCAAEARGGATRDDGSGDVQ